MALPRAPLWIAAALAVVAGAPSASAQYAEGGARVLGLGRAGVALSGAWGHTNPAAWSGLAERRAGAQVSQAFGLSELRLAAASAATPTPFGTAALSARTYGFSERRETRVLVGFGRPVALSTTRRLDVGLSVGVETASVEGYDSHTDVLLNVGVQGDVLPGLRAGLSGRNLLGLARDDDDDLRQSAATVPGLTVGVAYSPSERATVVLDADQDLDFGLSVRAGAEVFVVPAFALRAGVSTEPVRFTAGAGFRSGSLRADLAVESHETLGLTPAVGVRGLVLMRGAVSCWRRAWGGGWPLVVVLALTASAARAQVPDSTETGPEVGAEFEALFEDDLAGDPTELLELLQALRDEPLDVNTATAEELAQVPALDVLVAGAIVRFRAENGPFPSLPGLRRVPGVTADVYLDARPYLTIGPVLESVAGRAQRYPAVPSARTVLDNLRYTAIQRLQRRLDVGAGFRGPDSLRAFQGSPDRIYTRLQATYRRQVSVNVTLEKDPGEAFRFDTGTNTYGYDYQSAHVAVLDVGRIDALIVGDYSAQYGQGLALWRASGFGKGPDAVGGPVRAGRGLRPYGSVDENNFFRGAALSVAVVPNVYVSAFASRRALDASVFTSDTTDFGDPDLPPGALDAVVTSLGADGLHRTDRELARKDALDETLFGGGAEYRLATGDVEGRAGVVATRSSFGTPIAPGTRPDELFDFAGTEATVVSAYLDAKTRLGIAFGELARGAGGGLGAVGGLGIDLGGGADLLVVGRRYDPDFTSLHGYPFGERNGIGRNERGVYVGARVKPSRSWTVNAYLDQYSFPFLRFNEPRPTRGVEALVHVEHRPRRYVRVYAQARTETRETGIDVPGQVAGSAVGGLSTQTRQTARLQGEWDANRQFRLRARIEGSRYVDPDPAAPTQYGSLVYQDVRWQARRWLRADARLTLFDTDGFDARLYAFENDLTGVFSIPALNGRGVRAYVLLSAEPVGRVTVQAKVAATWLRNVTRIGSGTSEVRGNRVSDLGLQVRVRL